MTPKRRTFLVAVGILLSTAAVTWFITIFYRAFSFLERTEITAALLVAFGCAGELWLLLPKPPTDKVKLKVFESKKHFLEKIIGGMVAIGVTVELIVLPVSLNETAKLAGKNLELERQLALARTNISRIDPMNQRVFDVDIYATVFLSLVDGEEKGFTFPTEDHNGGTWAFLECGTASDIKIIGLLLRCYKCSEGCTLLSEKPVRVFFARFAEKEHMEASGSAYGDTVSELYKRVTALRLNLPFSPYTTTIHKGAAELILNGTIHKQFDITGQPKLLLDTNKPGRYIQTFIRAPESPLTNSAAVGK
jgi:hypothetical protein